MLAESPVVVQPDEDCVLSLESLSLVEKLQLVMFPLEGVGAAFRA